MPNTTLINPHIHPRADERLSPVERVDLWWRRHRTRQVLRDLDPDQLADIGITEEQRAAECAKPFWRE